MLRRNYAAEGHSCQLLGEADDIEAVLRRVTVEEVYLAGTARQHDEIQHFIRVCERFGVPFALPAYRFRLERAQPTDRQAVSGGYLHYHHNESKPRQRALKRLFDIVASAWALWLLLPLVMAVIALIKLTSRGPIFFRQARVGLNGRTFNMLKFLSMVTNAEELKAQLVRFNEQSDPAFKMRNDPRITAVGRFIRKYSIDELPQLVNVLRGDMSVVGPRPPVLPEVEHYEAWQRRRLSVRPGRTCIWQVSGRNQISFEDWMYLDMQYIDHWSLAQDFNLIFRTVPVVITGRGASYRAMAARRRALVVEDDPDIRKLVRKYLTRLRRFTKGSSTPSWAPPSRLRAPRGRSPRRGARRRVVEQDERREEDSPRRSASGKMALLRRLCRTSRRYCASTSRSTWTASTVCT